MAAFLLSVDHAPPFGPIAMACYFVAALQLEFSLKNTLLFEQETTPVEQNTVPANQEIAPTEQETLLIVEVH